MVGGIKYFKLMMVTCVCNSIFLSGFGGGGIFKKCKHHLIVLTAGTGTVVGYMPAFVMEYMLDIIAPYCFPAATSRSLMCDGG